MDRWLLKDRAKAQLKGRWGMVILACFVYSLLGGSGGGSVSISSSFPQQMQVPAEVLFTLSIFIMIGSVIGLAIYGAIEMGMSNYMFMFVRRGSTNMDNLFSGFKKFKESLKVGLWHSLFVFLWSGLPILITTSAIFGAAFLTEASRDRGGIASVLLIITGPIMIAFTIIGTIKLLSYSATFYIKLENSELNGKECVTASKKMMAGHKWDYWVLQLSFIGWSILAILTLGIGFFWLVPYQKVTEANYFYELLDENGLLRAKVEGKGMYDDFPKDDNYTEAGKEDWNTNHDEYWNEKNNK